MDKDSENSYRHAFLIMEPKYGKHNTKHVLCAETDAERDEWVESLLQYVGVGVSEEEAPESKKHSKKKFSKDSIAKLNAQPISQLGKNDLNNKHNKLIATDSAIQQAQKADKKKGNTESTIARGDSLNHSSHHPSPSLSSSPSSSTLSSSMQSTNSLLQQS